MKNLLFIFLFFGLKAASQTAFPLYIPGSSNTDSIKQVVNVNGSPRQVYNIDLVKYRAALTARDTAAALRLLIGTNTSNISANTTAIGLKADKSATISINGSSKTLGSNPTFTITTSKQLVVNLADYADSTGATDATTGISNAIAATPIGGILFVGPGIFKTTGGHTITKKITIRGAGGVGYMDYANYANYRRGASVLYLTNATATLFDYSGESGVIENVDFRADSTITATTSIGLKISGGTGLRLINCSFYHFNIGTHIQNAGQWSIDKCMWEANNTGQLLVENSRLFDEGDASITSSWFHGNGTFSGVYGIKQLSGGGLKITNCKFNYMLSTCIDVTMTGASSILLSHGNSFENWNAYAIKIDPSTSFAFPVITGCQFSPYVTITGNAIYMNGATNSIKGAVITGNAFNGSANTATAVQLTSVTGFEYGNNSFTNWPNPLSTTNSTAGHIDRVKDLNTMTYAATMSFDANKSIVQQVTLAGATTITFNNFFPGEEFTLIIIQDATGGRIPTFTNGNWVGSAKIDLTPSGITVIKGEYSASNYTVLQAFPTKATYTTTQRNAMTFTTTGTLIYNSTTATNQVYNGTSWDDILAPSFSGSTTAGYSLSFGGNASQTAGNLYGIAVNKFGVETSMFGINKNTVTGSIPANGTYLSTYGLAGGSISIGRGGNNSLPSFADIFVNTSGLVGIGNQTSPQSILDVKGSVSFFYVAKTAAYTATINDYTIDCNGTFTVTLPTAVGITGRIYVIKNSGTGTITLAGTSAQTFDGATSPTLSTQYGILRIQSNGANWIVL